MKKVFSITLIAMVVSLNAQDLQITDNLNLRYSGKIGAENWYFPRKKPISSFPQTVNTIKGDLDLQFQFEIPLEFRINQRFQCDPEDKNRNRYEIDDLYLDYYADYWEVRAGLQIFSWKTVESVSFADFLNQTDLESDFLDAPKLSQLAVRFRYILDSDVDQTFELYYLPYMRPTRFPVGDNRFSFGLNISNNDSDHLYQDDAKEWQPQFALSYQRFILESIETRWFYFNGYNRFPGLIPNPAFSEFYHEYRLVHKAGLTFQGNIDAWLVKGEMVYTNYQQNVINQLGQKIKPSFLAYTVGFEYTFYSPFIENHDLGTILEIIGDSDSGKDAAELESFRPFQNHLFGGMRYTFNNVSDRSLLLGGFYDYKHGDIIIQFEYSERWFEWFTVNIKYMDITSDTDPISRFEHTDRTIFELMYNF
jgi:hypothetical protein